MIIYVQSPFRCLGRRQISNTQSTHLTAYCKNKMKLNNYIHIKFLTNKVISPILSYT